MLHDHLQRGLAFKRQLAGEHFVHHDAERIDIRPVVDLGALGLLGRDIVHRADGLLHHAGLLRGREGRDAEVGQLGCAVAQDDDILRLDVLMDDAAGVRMHERAADLLCKEHRLLPGQAALFLQIFLEGDALDQLHDDIVRAVFAADVVHGDDVVMAELGDRLGLDREPLADIRVPGVFVLEYFYGDITVEHMAARAVDDRHAAHADHVDDLIPAAEQFADILIHMRLTPPLPRRG